MRKETGFSLIELIIVIAILGILASISTVSYRGYVIKSERSEAQAVLVKIADAQEKYYLNNNRYASTAELAPIYALPAGGKWAYGVTRQNGNQQFTATATNAEDADCPAMNITSGNSLGNGSWNADSSCD
ncbi:MAG: type IV pilin protein [Pseudomonadota bacterium]